MASSIVAGIMAEAAGGSPDGTRKLLALVLILPSAQDVVCSKA
jgi:hypothetical protein